VSDPHPVDAALGTVALTVARLRADLTSRATAWPAEPAGWAADALDQIDFAAAVRPAALTTSKETPPWDAN